MLGQAVSAKVPGMLRQKGRRWAVDRWSCGFLPRTVDLAGMGFSGAAQAVWAASGGKPSCWRNFWQSGLGVPSACQLANSRQGVGRLA